MTKSQTSDGDLVSVKNPNRPFKPPVGMGKIQYEIGPMETIKYILKMFKYPSFDRDKVEWLVKRVEELEEELEKRKASSSETWPAL